MNEKVIAGVVGALALAAVAGVAVDALSEKGEPPQAREENPKGDPRPIIEPTERTKASPTAAERMASRPGRLPDGGSVVWTISGSERVRIAAPCVIPDCWTLRDGGWNDSAVVDCRATGLRGLPDGGPRWNGCNVIPVEESTGAQCRPTACAVDFSGVPDSEVLR